jgi:hypothetical protein
MSHPHPGASRRRFLQHLAVGTAAVGTLPSALAAAPSDAGSSDAPGDLPVAREAAAFDAAGAQEQEWDTTWTQRVTGRHRAVFDSPELEGGSGVYRAGMWAGHYQQVLKVSGADISNVIVIRHAAIPLAMTHEFWDEYDLAKTHRIMHPLTGKKMRRNPVLLDAETDGLPPFFASLALDRQIVAGATVLACNLAFAQMVRLVSARHKLQGSAARNKALEGLVPGVIMQPSGIFAVMMAQEAGCHFIRAS